MVALNKKIMISLVHGTYGHQDDGFGAVQLANAILARGGEVTLFLRSDGVYLIVKGQDPNDLGLPSNLDELADFIELGGVIKTVKEAVEERGLKKEDLINDHELIEWNEVIDLLASGFFAGGDRALFQPLVDALLGSDDYLALADFASYLEAQDRVSQAFNDRERWTQMSILNVARMGRFSSDRAVEEYRRDIWRIERFTAPADHEGFMDNMEEAVRQGPVDITF